METTSPATADGIVKDILEIFWNQSIPADRLRAIAIHLFDILQMEDLNRCVYRLHAKQQIPILVPLCTGVAVCEFIGIDWRVTQTRMQNGAELANHFARLYSAPNDRVIHYGMPQIFQPPTREYLFLPLHNSV